MQGVQNGRGSEEFSGSPDETRPFQGHGQAKALELAGHTVLEHFRARWKWSADVKPLAGTDSCQAAHFGYVLSGRDEGLHGRRARVRDPGLPATWS